MGRYCWMCESVRPNEAFSGKNHGRHLCRRCARLPQAERDRKSRLSHLWDVLLRQSNISAKNIRQASEWAGGGDSEVASMAHLVADIWRVHPGWKKRLSYIRWNEPQLWQRMIAAGMVHDWPVEVEEEYWFEIGPEEIEIRPEENDESAFRWASEDDELPFF